MIIVTAPKPAATTMTRGRRTLRMPKSARFMTVFRSVPQAAQLVTAAFRLAIEIGDSSCSNPPPSAK